MLPQKKVFFSETMHFFCWIFSILHTCYQNFVSAVWFLSTVLFFAAAAAAAVSKELLILCLSYCSASLTMLLAPPTGGEKKTKLLDCRVVTGYFWRLKSSRELNTRWVQVWKLQKYIGMYLEAGVRSLKAARGRSQWLQAPLIPPLLLLLFISTFW